MKRLKKGNECSGLGRTQILSIRWHIPAALDHLPDQLIFGKTQSNTVERGAALASSTIQRVTVVTLLRLKNQLPLTFQSGAPLEILSGNRLAAPCIHDGTPRRVLAQMRQGAETHGDQQNGQDRNRPALPTFFTFACNKRERDKHYESDCGAN